MNSIWYQIKKFNWKLWLAIFLIFLIPSVYKLVRIFWLGSMPDDSQINIASQLSWVNLFYEIIQEALILPLFFLLGKSINDINETTNKVKTGILTILIVYLILAIIIIPTAGPLVSFMGQKKELIDQTITYVRIETVAFLFLVIWKFISLVLITVKSDKYIYITLLIQLILSIIFDLFLVSNLNFSAKLGAIGIPITNIITNIIILIVTLILLIKININVFTIEKLSFKWLKEWMKIGIFSLIESLFRNLAFMLMIVRMVNMVNEQGNYWIANSFIWDLLLLPSLALADLVKKEIGENKNNISEKTFGYIIICTIFAMLWIASIPSWKPLLQYVLKANNVDLIFNILLIQLGFYLTFIFNSCILDSTFYGMGKTYYMLIQSIVIDIIYYGIIFILFLVKVYVPNIYLIAIMFGGGMLLDFIPTILLYVYMIKKEKIKINFNYKNNITTN